jgi:hypothetical protein
MIKAEVRSYFLPFAERNRIDYGCKTLIDCDSSTVVTKSLFEGHPCSALPVLVMATMQLNSNFRT